MNNIDLDQLMGTFNTSSIQYIGIPLLDNPEDFEGNVEYLRRLCDRLEEYQQQIKDFIREVEWNEDLQEEQSLREVIETVIENVVEETVLEDIETVIESVEEELSEENVGELTEENTEELTEELTEENVEENTEELTEENVEAYDGLFGRFSDRTGIGIGDLSVENVRVRPFGVDSNIDENYKWYSMENLNINNSGVVSEHDIDEKLQEMLESSGENERSLERIRVYLRRLEVADQGRNLVRIGDYNFEGFDKLEAVEGEIKLVATLSSIYKSLYDREVKKHLFKNEYVFVVKKESIKEDIKLEVTDSLEIRVFNGERRVRYLEDKIDYLFRERGCNINNIVTVLKTKFVSEPEITSLGQLLELEWRDEYGRVE